MNDAMIAALSGIIRAVPDWIPGKTRLGRMLLRPFMARSPAVMTDRIGCTYVLPSYHETIAQHLFTFGAYERDTQDVILTFLPKSGTFVDVGANIGALAIPIAKARPGASVVCLEADPDICRILGNNLAKNGCGHVRLVCCVAGAADDQPVSFYRAPNDQFGMGSIGPQFLAKPITLAQRTLDGVAEDLKLGEIDVIKIDVEGAELGVLRGAQSILGSKRPPIIVFEFADWAEARIPGQKAGDSQTALFASGYRLFRLSGFKIDAELLTPLRTGMAMLVALPPHVSVPFQP